MQVHVRCPAERCGLGFDFPGAWLGRNAFCPGCGTRMTVREAADAGPHTRRPRREARAAEGAPERLPLAVLVDNVRSLWNVGSIFRTADACGVERIVLTGITGCPPRAEITKTALGADAWVAWEYEADARRALARLTAQGYRAVALESGGEAIDRVAWPSPLCLVIGNEVVGVSPGVLAACERRVTIPMRGVKASLNVAVAFGIAAHRAASGLAEG